MKSRLHKIAGHPYYIYAPDYRESSSGICALHYLCHALNLEGYDAYIAGANKLNIDLKTPVLTNEISSSHRSRGLVPIGVYPDVATGNPLGADICVRYMLNREGVVSGNKINAGTDDLFFYYSSAFTPSHSDSHDLLTVPTYDTELFSVGGVDSGEKRPKLLYVNRIPIEAIDFSRLPADVEILSMANPLSLDDLAEKLKAASILYSFELSGTCTLAMLCGCPVVALDLAGYEELGFSEKNLAILEGNGYTRVDTIEGVNHARATLPGVRKVYERLEAGFWKQLEVFNVKTQERANIVFQNKRNFISDAWLGKRVPKVKEVQLLGEFLRDDPEVLGVFILDLDGAGEINRTIESVAQNPVLNKFIKIFVIGKSLDTADTLDSVSSIDFIETEDFVGELNRQVLKTSCSWLMVLHAGDELTAGGLWIALSDLKGASSCRAVFADEVVRQETGELGLGLRPDVNLDLLLSFPVAMARHWIFRRDVWRELNGFAEDAKEAFELEFILRLIETQGLNGIGHISEPLVISDAVVLQDNPQERLVIEQHLHARGFDNATVSSRLPARYEIDYGHVSRPFVSILIAIDGHLARAQRCIETLLQNTTYPNYEVLLLDYGNSNSAVEEWLVGIEKLRAEQISVLRFSADMSLQHLSNQAALQTKGDFLLWLDSSAGIMGRDWLQQLLNHAIRPEVGAVGAKLLSGEGKIRHAGLLLGLRGPAGCAFEGMAADEAGYLQRLQVDQNYSALSGQCLMVRRDLFIEVGGFEEDAKFSRWADVDLCLKFHQAGYLNVWTPRVQLLVSESVDGAPGSEEEDAMYARWLSVLAHDPAHNPNFSLAEPGGVSLRDSSTTWRPLSCLQMLPTVLAYPADKSGCGHYRVRQPYAALHEAGLIEGAVSETHLQPAELERFDPQTVVFQRQITEPQIDSMRKVKVLSRAFKIYELDDYLPNVPLKSVHRGTMPRDIVKSLRRALSFTDRFVVSTQPLAEAFAGLHGDIRVIPNCLPVGWWGNLHSERRQGRKPRVGWAGGGGHRGDLELILDVVKAFASEVEWVFFGMCPEKLRPYIHELHEGVSIDQYPAKLASMNLDLALAPLEQNLFNDCKSNLRLLEYGACGFPVICSDVLCYRGDLPVTRVKNRYKDWSDAIRMHLSDLDASAKAGDALREQVLRDWMLDGENLIHWRTAWLPA